MYLANRLVIQISNGCNITNALELLRSADIFLPTKTGVSYFNFYPLAYGIGYVRHSNTLLIYN